MSCSLAPHAVNRSSSNTSDDSSFTSQSGPLRDCRAGRDRHERHRCPESPDRRRHSEGQRPPHDGRPRQESPGAPSLTDRGAMVTDASRIQRPSSMSLSHQRSHTPGSLHTPAQASAVECFCLQTEYIVVIYFKDRLIQNRRLEELRADQRRLRFASTPVAGCVSVGPTAEACQCVVN
jgi:hypothetical protein